METTTEQAQVSDDLTKRRGAILDVIDQIGSQKAASEVLDISESRLSKALNLKTISDRRLAPIERAIDKWKDSKLPEGNEDLIETGRMTYLQLVGPGGRVMLEVEMVIKATTKPHQVPLDVKERLG